MKKILIGVLPVLTAAAILSTAQQARAQGYYFDLHVGYNIVDNGDLEYDTGSVTAGYEQRPAFGGSFGYHDEGGFRIEGELTHRFNDIDYVGAGYAKGDLTSLSLMVNLLYELKIGGSSGYGYGLGTDNPLRPYVGLGAGGSRYTLSATDDLAAPNIVDDITYGFAYQGILGFGVAVTENAMLTLDFRYMVADNTKFTQVDTTPFEIDVIYATAMVGLRTTF